VHARETIHFSTMSGTRIVASPSTLDSFSWPASATALRFAADDVFVIGGESIGVSGEHVIVAADAGYSGCWLTADQLAHVAEHIDWPLPTERPALCQGFVASVPAKLYLTGEASGSEGGDRVALLMTNTPYAPELQERLS
jgi:hypothetical protein